MTVILFHIPEYSADQLKSFFRASWQFFVKPGHGNSK